MRYAEKPLLLPQEGLLGGPQQEKLDYTIAANGMSHQQS